MFMIHLDDIVCGAYCHALERCENENADASMWYMARRIPMRVLDDYAHAVRQRLASDTGDAILSLDRDQTWDMVKSSTDVIDYDEWVAHNLIAIRDGVTAEQVAKKLAGGIPTATIRALEHPSCVSVVDEWLDSDNKWSAVPPCERNDDDDDDGEVRTGESGIGTRDACEPNDGGTGDKHHDCDTGSCDADQEHDVDTSNTDAKDEDAAHLPDTESEVYYSSVTMHEVDTEPVGAILLKRDGGRYVVTAASLSHPVISIAFDNFGDACDAYAASMSSFVRGTPAFDAIADVISGMRETQ